MNPLQLDLKRTLGTAERCQHGVTTSQLHFWQYDADGYLKKCIETMFRNYTNNQKMKENKIWEVTKRTSCLRGKY
jgi:hypothetical protein